MLPSCDVEQANRFFAPVIRHDGPVRCADDAVDQFRWLFAAQEVLAYGRDRKLGNQELREAYLFTSFFPEDYPRPFV